MKTLLNNERVVLALLGIVFFFFYAWLYLIDGNIFQSPDEMANYQFAVEYAQDGDFTIESRVSDHTFIHPRSVNVTAHGDYVPVGFIGMPLIYGFLAKLFGLWSLSVFPAFVAIVGAYAFYALMKTLFSKQQALLACCLLLTLPPWWYYATRGLLPNVSFLSFLLLGTSCLLYARTSLNGAMLQIIAGLSYGLAFLIRPIEFVWVGLALVLTFIVTSNKKIYKRYWIFLLLVISSVLLYFGLNHWVYGEALLTGYDSLAAESPSISLWQRVQQLLFPFGVSVIDSLTRFSIYSFTLLAPYSILTILGLYSTRNSIVHKKYTVVFFAISAYLIFYYGSWEVQDHPDIERVSIGVSYLRYWLPVYLLALPFVVSGIEFIASKSHIYRDLIRIFGVLICIVWGAYMVLAKNDDAIPNIIHTSQEAIERQEMVVNATTEQAIIVSQRNDKLFWPKRETIHFQNNDYAYLGELTGIQELYWYTALPLDHIYDIEKRYLTPNQMALGDILMIDEQASLRLIQLQTKTHAGVSL